MGNGIETSAGSSSHAEESLPSGFQCIQRLRDPEFMSDERLRSKPPVNVIGVVAAFRPPKLTRGLDWNWKCELEIKDISSRFDPVMKVDFFLKDPNQMPKATSPGDVLLLRHIKAQKYKDSISLISDKSNTRFYVLPSKAIPGLVAKAPWSASSAAGRPTALETKYAMWLSQELRDALPTSQEFQLNSKQSLSSRGNKFSLLKDVQQDNFYDILGQVIKVFDPGYEKFTLYLSDYTHNKQFHTYERNFATGEVAGDPFGYTTSRSNEAKEWPGPFGQYTIQLTLFDENAYHAREHVQKNDWVLLKNVHVRVAKNGPTLEGYLRGDGSGRHKIQAMPPQYHADDPRLKDAVKRRQQWEKKFQRQTKAFNRDIQQQEARTGEKRKLKSNAGGKSDADEAGTKLGAKQRRTAQRDRERELEGESSTIQVAKRIELNPNIKCNFPEQPIMPLSDLLKAKLLNGLNADDYAPFILKKGRANVRVVDYFPPNIQDFAIGRQVREASDYAIFSDYSSDEDSDAEDFVQVFRRDNGFAERIWEWGFMLVVEDADPDIKNKEQIPLMVNNADAQMLLGLSEDACDLRKNPEVLQKLKNQLFKLWGDLEEHKSRKLAKEIEESRGTNPANSSFSASSYASAMSSPSRMLSQPPIDSEDEETPGKGHDLSKSGEQGKGQEGTKGEEQILETVKNLGFTCCIRQYGVKETENDPRKADAGKGKRWERVYGMFGTQIH